MTRDTIFGTIAVVGIIAAVTVTVHVLAPPQPTLRASTMGLVWHAPLPPWRVAVWRTSEGGWQTSVEKTP
jgi:hypothetical protein